MPIKVCHIITKLELGGAQQNTLYTVRHLSRGRFQPILIAGSGGILDAEASADSRFVTFFIPELVRSVVPWGDIIALFKLWRILRAEKPAVVHTHSSKAGILGRWAAWLARVPVIIHTIHGFGFNDRQRFFVRYAFILIEWCTAFITDKMVVVTDEDRKKGLSLHIGTNKKYTVIRSGIDTDAYKTTVVVNNDIINELSIPSSSKVITTIGPFKPQKNLADFVRVAALISASRTDCVFLIVGDGDQRAMLESMAREAGLTASIRFLGWRTDIIRILAITDVFVMTSLWEGLPRSILEAMCRGVPVVANSVDGVREIVRDGITGHLVAPFEIEEMAKKINQILDNPETARNMGGAARTVISKEFDINFMVCQQEELYAIMTGSMSQSGHNG